MPSLPDWTSSVRREKASYARASAAHAACTCFSSASRCAARPAATASSTPEPASAERSPAATAAAACASPISKSAFASAFCAAALAASRFFASLTTSALRPSAAAASRAPCARLNALAAVSCRVVASFTRSSKACTRPRPAAAHRAASRREAHTGPPTTPRTSLARPAIAAQWDTSCRSSSDASEEPQKAAWQLHSPSSGRESTQLACRLLLLACEASSAYF